MFRADKMLRQATTKRSGLLLRNINHNNNTYTRITVQRRFASTDGNNPIVPPPPSQKQRSWKNKLVRLGLAGAAIYYYNTSSMFANDNKPTFSLQNSKSAVAESEDDAATLSSLSSKSNKKATPVAEQQQHQPSSIDAQPEQPAQPHTGEDGQGGLEDLESQAGTEGAFNPETGEINWDCPCLGGMAHGPCGEEFKAAFSCFVYSTEEPKGMDCIEKFKGMQDCFRQHPDVYGSELEDDEVDEQLTEQIAQRDKEDQSRRESEQQEQPQQQQQINDPASANLNQAEKRAEIAEMRKANERTEQSAQEEEALVPRAWHDSEGAKKTEK